MEASRLEELYRAAPKRALLTPDDVIEEARERMRRLADILPEPRLRADHILGALGNPAEHFRSAVAEMLFACSFSEGKIRCDFLS